MGKEDSAKKLREQVGVALAYREKNLESRPSWGSITFEKAKPEFTRIFELLSHLSILPLEYATDAALVDMTEKVSEVISIFDSIDRFSIEQQNPGAIRDSLVGSVATTSERLYASASPWVPFLAYQKGDVSKNIEQLTSSVRQAEGLVETARTTIANRMGEIERIVTQAREASAAAGAAVFTQDFKKEAKDLATAGKKWLKVTGALALCTLFFALGIWWFHSDSADTLVVGQRFGGKLAVLVVLFTATLWCGRTYKALMHLETTNRHRALSLQTFQAFSSAASDDSTKDAVLMEATRAIFGSVPTGYLDSKTSSEQDIKIVEIARTFAGKGTGTQV